jgi:hypothetical protein
VIQTLKGGRLSWAMFSWVDAILISLKAKLLMHKIGTYTHVGQVFRLEMSICISRSHNKGTEFSLKIRETSRACLPIKGTGI